LETNHPLPAGGPEQPLPLPVKKKKSRWFLYTVLFTVLGLAGFAMY
jgi:hypothetical protein